MNSSRRGLFSRLGFRHNRDPSPAVERFDLRTSAKEDYSPRISIVLPPYSRYEDPINRPPSPAPTYCTVDEPRSPTFRPIFPETRNEMDIDAQIAIDKIVNRLRESLKNSKAWRRHRNGERSFFWALRCAPGTADLLQDHMAEIRDRVLITRDWRIEKFCFIFKGQKLGDLFCSPIQTEVYLRFCVQDLTFAEIWHPQYPFEGGLHCRTPLHKLLRSGCQFFVDIQDWGLGNTDRASSYSRCWTRNNSRIQSM